MVSLDLATGGSNGLCWGEWSPVRVLQTSIDCYQNLREIQRYCLLQRESDGGGSSECGGQVSTGDISLIGSERQHRTG